MDEQLMSWANVRPEVTYQIYRESAISIKLKCFSLQIIQYILILTFVCRYSLKLS